MSRQLLGSLIIAIFISATAQLTADDLPARYHTYQQILNDLTILRNTFPEVVKLDTMGYSNLDHVPLIRLKISDNANFDEDEPSVLLCASAHADEVLGPEVILTFATDIIRRYSSQDTQAIRFINSTEIYCIPFINPEGRLVVEGGDLYWRKNKSDNNGNGLFDYYDGVDNNRNYDLFWQYDPTTDPANPEYKGPSPLSESENRAMAALVNKYKPIIAVDFHSPATGQGNIVYYPWSLGSPGADINMIYGIGSVYCSRIRTYWGNTFDISNASVRGDLRTYLFGQLGTVNFTVELADTTIENPDRVDTTVARQLPGIYYLLGRALGPAITGVIKDSVTLEPLEAEVQVVGRTSSYIRPRYSRLDNGRYYRILEPGTYTLRFIKTDYLTRQITGVQIGATSPVVTDVLLSPIHPRPPAPRLLYPEQNNSFNTGIFAFGWTNPPLYNKFRLEIAADSSFAVMVFSDSTLLVSYYRLTSSLDIGHYYWRVKAGNNNGWGPYSPIWDFFVQSQNAAGDKPNLPSEYYLYQNYPNPFNSTTTITFDLPKQSPVELSCYDITGALVTRLESKILAAGHHIYKWDGSDNQGLPIASGIYFCKLKAGEYGAITKMIVLK